MSTADLAEVVLERGDQPSLFLRSHAAAEEKARMVIVHGLGEHSGRYLALADHLADMGFSLWIPDLRGHGRSGGDRGHVDAFDDYLSDVREILDRARSDKPPGIPLFLLGHSMGGLVSILAALQFQDQIDGLVLSSPAVGVAVPLPAVKKAAARLLARLLPRLGIKNELDPQTVSRDPDTVRRLAGCEPDILVVAAYGLILPQSVLDIPKKGCLNVHASLLPRWRGAAPIQAAILAGDSETGISLMAMTEGLDCGPVYVEEAVAIGPEETAGELHDRLANLGGELLVRHFDAIVSGALAAEEQDDARATYAGKISKQDARLDWQQPAAVLHRQVRAYNPVPGAFFFFDDTPIKCWRARVINDSVEATPGDVLSADRNGIVVACGRDALCIDNLQRPGKRPVTAGEFSNSVVMTGRRLG